MCIHVVDYIFFFHKLIIYLRYKAEVEANLYRIDLMSLGAGIIFLRFGDAGTNCDVDLWRDVETERSTDLDQV